MKLCNNHRTLKLQGSPGAWLYRPGEGRGHSEPVLERVSPSHLDHRVWLAGMKYLCERPVAKFRDPWLGDKVDSGIGLSYRAGPPTHVAWRTGMKTLCRSWLYPHPPSPPPQSGSVNSASVCLTEQQFFTILSYLEWRIRISRFVLFCQICKNKMRNADIPLIFAYLERMLSILLL
jgi:hypothetical protein